MDKTTAFKLLKLVNSPEWPAFVAYQESLLKEQREIMDEVLPINMDKHQGRIYQIKETINLRNEVLNVVNKD